MEENKEGLATYVEPRRQTKILRNMGWFFLFPVA